MRVVGGKLPLTLAEGVNMILKMSLQQIAVAVYLGGSTSLSQVIPRMSAVRPQSCTGPTCSNGEEIVR